MHLNRKEMCIGFAAKKVKCVRKLQVPEKIGKLLLKGLAPQVCQEYVETDRLGSSVLLIG